MEETQLEKKSGLFDFLAVIGLGFTAIFWTIDTQMIKANPDLAITDIPAKRYLMMAFAAIWLIAAGLYTVRVVMQKQSPDKALLLGGFFGMMVGELMAFRKLIEFWWGDGTNVLQGYDPGNPLDIGGTLWTEQWVQFGIIFAGVGLALFMISFFPALLRRKKK